MYWLWNMSVYKYMDVSRNTRGRGPSCPGSDDIVCSRHASMFDDVVLWRVQYTSPTSAFTLYVSIWRHYYKLGICKTCLHLIFLTVVYKQLQFTDLQLQATWRLVKFQETRWRQLVLQAHSIQNSVLNLKHKQASVAPFSLYYTTSSTTAGTSDCLRCLDPLDYKERMIKTRHLTSTPLTSNLGPAPHSTTQACVDNRYCRYYRYGHGAAACWCYCSYWRRGRGLQPSTTYFH